MKNFEYLSLPQEILVDTGNKDLVNRIQSAQAHPLAESFTHSVQRLAAMACRIGGKVRLSLDFSPMSLGWAVMRAEIEFTKRSRSAARRLSWNSRAFSRLMARRAANSCARPSRSSPKLCSGKSHSTVPSV